MDSNIISFKPNKFIFKFKISLNQKFKIHLKFNLKLKNKRNFILLFKTISY